MCIEKKKFWSWQRGPRRERVPAFDLQQHSIWNTGTWPQSYYHIKHHAWARILVALVTSLGYVVGFTETHCRKLNQSSHSALTRLRYHLTYWSDNWLMVLKQKGFPKFITLNVEHISPILPPWKMCNSFFFFSTPWSFSEAKLVYPWDYFLQCCIWIIKCYGRATWVYHHAIIDHCLDKNVIFFLPGVQSTSFVTFLFVCLFVVITLTWFA